jgi:WD40 repeat protein
MQDPTIYEAHASYVLGLLFTADSSTLVSAGMDNVVKLWTVPDWKLIRAFEAHDHSVNAIALSPDERVLATASSDRTTILWSFPDGQLLHRLQDRKKVVSAVTISDDGRWLCVGSYGGRVALWTLQGEQVAAFKASQGNLSSVSVAPGGELLATSGLGSEIHLWSLPAGDRVATLLGHETAVGSLRFIRGGRQLVSLGYEGTVRFWGTESWRATRVHPVAPAGSRGLVISPDEKRAALSLDGAVRIYRLEAWEQDVQLQVGTRSIGSMAFSPDGRWFAAGAADRKIRVWETDWTP